VCRIEGELHWTPNTQEQPQSVYERVCAATSELCRPDRLDSLVVGAKGQQQPKGWLKRETEGRLCKGSYKGTAAVRKSTLLRFRGLRLLVPTVEAHEEIPSPPCMRAGVASTHTPMGRGYLLARWESASTVAT
jgi:hypothetical protein